MHAEPLAIACARPCGGRVAFSPEAAAFHRDGFIAPVDLLTPAQCELILKHYRLDPRRDQRRGRKALGATDRLFNDIATRPALLQLLKTILGDDIILWGTRVINQEPGGVHEWHTDIESAAPDGRFISVWIGLENTCKKFRAEPRLPLAQIRQADLAGHKRTAVEPQRCDERRCGGLGARIRRRRDRRAAGHEVR